MNRTFIYLLSKNSLCECHAVLIVTMMKVQGSWNQLPVWAEQLRQPCTPARGCVHWSCRDCDCTVLSLTHSHIGVGDQSTLGQYIFVWKYVWTKFPLPEFYMTLARKLTKCPNFTWYSPQKYFSQILGSNYSTLPSPVSCAYAFYIKPVRELLQPIVIYLSCFRPALK